MFYLVLKRLFAAKYHRHDDRYYSKIEIDALLGGGVGDANYRHVQTVAADTWVVTHNLGKYPTVQVVDSSGQVVLGDINHDSINQVTVSFSAITSGEAYCN